MGILDLFSKRQKAERGELPDVYQYEKMPQGLKVQVVHILDDAFGHDQYFSEAKDAFTFLRTGLCREYGTFDLYEGSRNHDPRTELFNFLLKEENVEKNLDVVEISFRYIDRVIRKSSIYKERAKPKCTPDDAIAELNARFQYVAFGYRYESGQIVRISTEFTHSELVRPALLFLSDKRFSGANEEFLQAHQFFRSGENKDCINNCLKAFESTMKAICKIKGISVDATATSKPLIAALFKSEFVPMYLQSQFSSLQSLFESGVPTIRNKSSGHGQGSEVVKLETTLTAYVLHLTASNIVFLGTLV